LDSIPGPASVLEKKAEGPESPKDPTPVKQQPKAKAKAKAATAAAAAATATATAKTTTKSSKLVPEPVKSSTPTQKVQPASQKTDTLPHQSPSKRVGIPSSRLPSPTKKQSLAGRIDPLDVKKVEAVVHKAFSSRDTAKLSGVLDDLKTTRAEQIFNDYRANAEIRFRNSDDLISSLTSRNNELANEVNSLRSHVASLEKQTSNVNEEEQFQSQLILDMMEQIVGLRIHRAQETEDALSFDCSQSGKNGSTYQSSRYYPQIILTNNFSTSFGLQVDNLQRRFIRDHLYPDERIR
jgi:hypothetical protein